MLRLVRPICRPRQIGERISACEWQSDGGAIPIRQAGRFRKIRDHFTDFHVSGPILKELCHGVFIHFSDLTKLF